ncbi:MAG: hypothetical protein ACM3S5_15795 [Rhodospirillales bacterium]
MELRKKDRSKLRSAPLREGLVCRTAKLSNNKTWVSIAALLILLLAVFLRVYHIDSESVEGDELFSRRVALAETREAWALARVDLVHPPLYYFALKVTLPSGDASTAFDIRRLSLAAGAAAIVLTILIGFAAPELRVPALLAAVLLALNKIHIFYSQQARSYALFTALVALLLLWRVVAGRHWQRPWYWVSGTILMAAITWTHYVGALFCAACVLPMTFTNYCGARTRAARVLPMISLVVAALLFLPWLIPELAIYRQRGGLSENLAWQGLPDTFHLKMAFANHVGIPDFRGATTLAFFVGAFLVCGAFLPKTGAESVDRNGVRLTSAMMAIAPPVVLWLSTRWPLHLPIFADRHLLPAIVPTLILMCYGLTRIAWLAGKANRTGWLFGFGAIVLCAFQIAPVCRDWPGPIRHPYATIAADLERIASGLPVYTTLPYGIGEPVSFHSRYQRKIDGLPELSEVSQLPHRLCVLYRPAVTRENERVQPLLQRYDVVMDKYYSGAGSPRSGTRLLVLSRR